MKIPASFQILFFALGGGIVVFAAGVGVGQITPPETALTVLRILPVTASLAFIFLAAVLFAFPRGAMQQQLAERLIIFVGIAVIGFVLAAKWRAMASSDVIFAGLLPTSDAAAYFGGALHFLHLGELTAWTTRRPLSTLQLATFLGAGSLEQALFALTALATAAIFCVIAVLSRSTGGAGAAIAAAVLVPFYFPTVGSVMSENIGLAFGATGFALMWIAVTDPDRRKAGIFAFGAGLMAMGLVARAGAMFVMPMLVIFAAWFFRGDKRLSIKAAAWAFAAIGLAFAVNAGVIARFGAEGGGGFSNFAYTLYGLVTGGHPWQYVYEVVPSLKSLPEAEQAGETYRLALAHLAAHPLDAVRGVFRRYNDFVFNARWFRADGIGALRFVFTAVALVGLFHVIRQRRDPLAAFVLAGAIGTLLSVPFIGDGGMRIHAATVAFSAALVGFGAIAVAGWLRCPSPEPRAGFALVSIPVVIAVITFLPMASAITLGGIAGRPVTPETCGDKTVAGVFATLPASGLDLRSRADKQWVQEAAAPRVILPRGFERLAPPVRLSEAIELTGRIGGAFFITTPAGKGMPTRFAACARRDGDIWQLENISAPR